MLSDAKVCGIAATHIGICADKEIRDSPQPFEALQLQICLVSCTIAVAVDRIWLDTTGRVPSSCVISHRVSNHTQNQPLLMSLMRHIDPGNSERIPYISSVQTAPLTDGNLMMRLRRNRFPAETLCSFQLVVTRRDSVACSTCKNRLLRLAC